jgi:signal transduction histidine kinase
LNIRRVSDSIAHELRTPLARLHADLSELTASATPERRPLVEAAVREAEKLVELFDAVLRIARIESIGESIAMEDIDLSALLADVVEIFGPSAEDKDVALETLIAEGLHVTGNANLLFQAIGNIIDNAIKYTPRRGTVRVEALDSAQGVVLRVSDNGSGIPVDQRQNVFERFVRLPQTSHVSGTGLGLSFVKVAMAEPARRLIWTTRNPACASSCVSSEPAPRNSYLERAVQGSPSGPVVPLHRRIGPVSSPVETSRLRPSARRSNAKSS